MGAAAIQRFHRRLLAEHLGQRVETVRESLERTGSLISTIDTLSTPERGLVPLGNEYPEWLEKLASGSALSDPRRPLSLTFLLEASMPERFRYFVKHPAVRTGAVAGTLAAVGFSILLLRRR